jgi:hypothetical protein
LSRRRLSTAPLSGTIDWRTHVGAVLSGLEAMHRIVGRGGDDPQWLMPILTQEMRWIALRLRSRHVPRQVRTRFPEIPWQGIAAWLEREDAIERASLPLLEKDTALIDFARAAPALAGPLKDLQKELVMTAADGNERDGILAWERRATFVHVTLRLPADRVPLVLEALSYAYDGLDAPTVTGVRAGLSTINDALGDLGVKSLRAIGSVARGVATPASDIDLLYEALPTDNAWRLWCDLLALLERTLGRVVDLHQAGRMPPRLRSRAVVVWKRNQSDRKRKAKA